MSTTLSTTNPKYPQWDEPAPLVWRSHDRKVDGRTNDGKFTKTLLASTEYVVTLVEVELPYEYSSTGTRWVEAIHVRMHDSDCIDAIEKATQCIERGLFKAAIVVTEALIDPTGRFADLFLESTCVFLRQAENGLVIEDKDLGKRLNRDSKTTFVSTLPETDEDGRHNYAHYNEGYSAREAIEKMNRKRAQAFHNGKALEVFTGAIEKADAAVARKTEHENRIEATKAAHPLSAYDRDRIVQARKFLETLDEHKQSGFYETDRVLTGVIVDMAKPFIEHALDLIGSTTLEKNLSHVAWMWAMNEDPRVIDVSMAIVEVTTLVLQRRGHGDRVPAELTAGVCRIILEAFDRR